MSALENREVLAVEPSGRSVYSAQWSPHRPALLAAGAGDGRVHFFDISRDVYQPAKVLEALGSRAGSVNAVAFNPAQKEFFAAAHGAVVKVWTLGPGLTDMSPQELRVLESLAME